MYRGITRTSWKATNAHMKMVCKCEPEMLIQKSSEPHAIGLFASSSSSCFGVSTTSRVHGLRIIIVSSFFSNCWISICEVLPDWVSDCKHVLISAFFVSTPPSSGTTGFRYVKSCEIACEFPILYKRVLVTNLLLAAYWCLYVFMCLHKNSSWFSILNEKVDGKQCSKALCLKRVCVFERVKNNEIRLVYEWEKKKLDLWRTNFVPLWWMTPDLFCECTISFIELWFSYQIHI